MTIKTNLASFGICGAILALLCLGFLFVSNELLQIGLFVAVWVYFLISIPKVPVGSVGYAKFLGKRLDVFFSEGFCCLPYGIFQLQLIDTSPQYYKGEEFQVSTKGKDPIDAKIDLTFCIGRDKTGSLDSEMLTRFAEKGKTPEEILEKVKQELAGFTLESTRAFVLEDDKTLEQCVGAECELQDFITENIDKWDETEGQRGAAFWGVTIRDVNVRKFMPVADLLKGHTEKRKKILDVQALKEGALEIQEKFPELSGKEALEHAELAQGKATKAITEQTGRVEHVNETRFELGPNTTEAVKRFLDGILPKEKKE